MELYIHSISNLQSPISNLQISHLQEILEISEDEGFENGMNYKLDEKIYGYILISDINYKIIIILREDERIKSRNSLNSDFDLREE
jgi:hypothetical protein